MPAKKAAEIPQVRDLTCDTDTRTALEQLIVRGIQLKSEIDDRQTEHDEGIKPNVKVLLKSIGIPRVRLEDWQCGWTSGSKSWLDADLLAESMMGAGLNAEQIADIIAASTRHTSYESVDFRGPKAKPTAADRRQSAILTPL